MTIRLGIAPIGWSNDDLPELGGDIPLEQCLAEARLAGYLGVEKGGKFPMDAHILGPILKRYGLDLASGWHSGKLVDQSVEDEKASVRAQLDLYLALGVPVMVYGETSGTVQNQINVPVADRPVLDADGFKVYAEKLSVFAEWIKTEGCPPKFPPAYGNGDRKRARSRSADADDRRCAGSVARYRPFDLCRCRR